MFLVLGTLVVGQVLRTTATTAPGAGTLESVAQAAAVRHGSIFHVPPWPPSRQLMSGPCQVPIQCSNAQMRKAAPMVAHPCPASSYRPDTTRP